MHYQGHFYFMCVLESIKNKTGWETLDMLWWENVPCVAQLPLLRNFSPLTSTFIFSATGYTDVLVLCVLSPAVSQWLYGAFRYISGPLLEQWLQFYSSSSQLCTNSLKTQYMSKEPVVCLVLISCHWFDLTIHLHIWAELWLVNR